MTHERLEGILTTTGWAKAKQHDSAKLTYWFLRRIPGVGGEGGSRGDGKVWKKEEVRKGVRRNNFCIVVGGKGEGEEDVEGDAEMGNEEEPAEDPDVVMDGGGGEEEEWGGC